MEEIAGHLYRVWPPCNRFSSYYAVLLRAMLRTPYPARNRKPASPSNGKALPVLGEFLHSWLLDQHSPCSRAGCRPSFPIGRIVAPRRTHMACWRIPSPSSFLHFSEWLIGLERPSRRAVCCVPGHTRVPRSIERDQRTDPITSVSLVQHRCRLADPAPFPVRGIPIDSLW